MEKQLFLVIICSFFLFGVNLQSQELDATVDIDMSSLNVDVKDRLVDFKNDISNYLNKTKFTDEVIVNDVKNKPYKIKCNFQFFFTGSAGSDLYNAQLVLFVQRNIFKTLNFSPLIKIKDESWEFNYIKGQSFYHDDLKFNSLTSFLDFYAYLIIGFDDDSWEYKLGDKRFQKARDVVNLASSSTSSQGWSDNTTLKASRNS